MRFPATKSERPPPSRFVRYFGQAIQLSLLGDQEVLRRANAIYSMLRPNRDLFARDLVARILLSAGREVLRNLLKPGPLEPMPPPRVD